jgi:hypothetical protein
MSLLKIMPQEQRKELTTEEAKPIRTLKVQRREPRSTTPSNLASP